MTNITLEQVRAAQRAKGLLDEIPNDYGQVKGVQRLPDEATFSMQNPLSIAAYAAKLGIKVNPDAKLLPDIDGGLLGSTETRTELEAVGHEVAALAVRTKDDYGRVLLSGPPVETLPIQAFLKPIFIEGTIIRKSARQLFFLDMANRMTTPTSEIVWYRDQFAAHNDPLLQDPAPLDEGAEAPLITVSDPLKKHVSTGKYAFAIEFTDRALRNDVTGFNEVQRKLDMAAYAFSARMNVLYANELASEFSVSVNNAKAADDQVIFSTVTDTWDDPAANPIQDILDLQLTMEEQDEFYYTPTDLWLPPKSWKDLYQYMISVDHDWVIDPQSGRQSITIADIRVTKVPPLAGIPDGNALMMALGADVPAPLDVWDEVDNRFTRTGMIHVRRIPMDLTMNVRFEFSRTLAIQNRNPKATAVFAGLR